MSESPRGCGPVDTFRRSGCTDAKPSTSRATAGRECRAMRWSCRFAPYSRINRFPVAEQLRRPVLQEEISRHDAQHREHPWALGIEEHAIESHGSLFRRLTRVLVESIQQAR